MKAVAHRIVGNVQEKQRFYQIYCLGHGKTEAQLQRQSDQYHS